MLAQLEAAQRDLNVRISNVVLMGMGEPLDNLDNVLRFIELASEEKGLHIGARHITLSTCGIIPGIYRFAGDFPQVNLAVSLHARNDEIRRRTMPVARKYAYEDLMKACRDYTESTHRRITFEYALIRDVNDSAENAEELASHLKGWLTHVNLIPLNEVKGRDYRTVDGSSVAAFKKILENKGIAVTVRRTLGSDIDAACGQLRANNKTDN
jgi:23S rRNA (adenine2503-C2)-methyltransferase